ncbi:MAG: tRNA lysidine(34) synthetase TilS [Prevotella sp.]|nr:tRNA lysidine(34) synthetase TilS [Prevotella sp.]
MARKGLFEHTIENFIALHRLMGRDKTTLVALSGGADSVALLHVLHALDYPLEAVHCNFQLRWEEADRDEEFCRSLCEDLGVAFHVVHFATREYAEAHHVSIEMAARFLRYDYFERLRIDIAAEVVAVAHHKDDSVETVLLNLVRGTGIHGLAGIAPKRDHIVRPLLCVGRSDIEAYLEEKGLCYVTDSSNLVDDVVRNKIRLHILPLMRDINPSVTESIAQTAGRVRQAAAVFDEAMEKRVADAVVEERGKGVMAYDMGRLSDEYTLFYILKDFGFSPAAVDDIFLAMQSHRTGAAFASATHELVFHRGKLLVRPLTSPFKPMTIPMEGCYVLSENKKLRVTRKAVDKDFVIPKQPTMVALDAEKVVFPLHVRQAAPGDRFAPLGMGGKTRLLSDFLTDLKVDLFQKRDQLLLTDASDAILWVVNRRPDHRFRITETTTHALLLELSE